MCRDGNLAPRMSDIAKTRSGRLTPGTALKLLPALVLSGCLMALGISSAIASPDGPWLGWLGWVSLVPLFISIRRLAPSRAMVCGALWGLSLYLFLVGLVPGFGGTVASLLLLAAVPAAYAYGAAHFTRRLGFSPLFLGLGWVAVELALRPLGLRTGLLSGTQGHGPLVDSVSALPGSGLVAFVVAAANATLVLVAGNVRLRSYRAGSSIAPQRRERSFPVTSAYRSFFDVCPAQPRAPPA